MMIAPPSMMKKYHAEDDSNTDDETSADDDGDGKIDGEESYDHGRAADVSRVTTIKGGDDGDDDNCDDGMPLSLLHVFS